MSIVPYLAQFIALYPFNLHNSFNLKETSVMDTRNLRSTQYINHCKVGGEIPKTCFMKMRQLELINVSRLRAFTLVTRKKRTCSKKHTTMQGNALLVMTTTPGRVARTGAAATRAGTRSSPRGHHATVLLPRGHRRLHTST